MYCQASARVWLDNAFIRPAIGNLNFDDYEDRYAPWKLGGTLNPPAGTASINTGLGDTNLQSLQIDWTMGWTGTQAIYVEQILPRAIGSLTITSATVIEIHASFYYNSATACTSYRIACVDKDGGAAKGGDSGTGSTVFTTSADQTNRWIPVQGYCYYSLGQVAQGDLKFRLEWTCGPGATAYIDSVYFTGFDD